jgi:hypothetical protein
MNPGVKIRKVLFEALKMHKIKKAMLISIRDIFYWPEAIRISTIG